MAQKLAHNRNRKRKETSRCGQIPTKESKEEMQHQPEPCPYRGLQCRLPRTYGATPNLVCGNFTSPQYRRCCHPEGNLKPTTFLPPFSSLLLPKRLTLVTWRKATKRRAQATNVRSERERCHSETVVAPRAMYACNTAQLVFRVGFRKSIEHGALG